jgi:thioredoxin reductase (NADPH)
MTFFSTAEKIEIADIPFPCVGPKPSKDEALQYYRQVALGSPVHWKLYTEVEGLGGARDDFTIRIDGDDIRARRAVVATGFFQKPVALGIPGENAPWVSHYFDDGHRYAGLDVVIVGGANSAAIAALECWRNGARVHLVHRQDGLSDSVKYWIKPDLDNRIAERSITAHFGRSLLRIDSNLVTLDDDSQLPAQRVLLLTGYRSDVDFLSRMGLQLDETKRPLVHGQAFEAEGRPGLHYAGCVLCGEDTGSLFIENGRHHAVAIAEHLADHMKRRSRS